MKNLKLIVLVSVLASLLVDLIWTLIIYNWHILS